MQSFQQRRDLAQRGVRDGLAHDLPWLSSNVCGSCHDVMTPAGVFLERTFDEWQDTLFATGDPRGRLREAGQAAPPGT
jgi:hypothetical protein